MDDAQTKELVVLERPTEVVVSEGTSLAKQQQRRLWVALASTLGGKVSEELVSQMLNTGPNSQSQLMMDANLTYIAEQIEEMASALQRIEENGVQLHAADVQNVLTNFYMLSRDAVGKKRRYLANAMKKAFSLRMYEQGNIARFQGYLEDLQYGELCLLEFIVGRSTVPPGGNGLDLPQMLKEHFNHHAAELEKVGLLKAEKNNHNWRVSSIVSEFVWFITADDEELDEGAE